MEKLDLSRRRFFSQDALGAAPTSAAIGEAVALGGQVLFENSWQGYA